MIDDYLDTEDPHPITRAENPYGFDEYTNRQLESPRRPGNPARVSASRAGKRDSPSSARKNGARVSGFVQSIQELSPLVHLAQIQIENEFTLEEYEENLSSLIRVQHAVLGDICNRIGLNSDDIGDRFLVGQLSMRISKVIYRLRALPSTVVKDCIHVAYKELDRWTQQNATAIREIINERNISSDIVVNVKLGLFSPTIRLYGLFEKWGIGSWKDKHAGWLMDLAVDFARDLSFNWDKQAIFKDKQTLFQGVLENCADLVIDVYEDYLRRSLKARAIADYSSENDELGKFYQALENMDMGYMSHEELNIGWLKPKMISRKDGMLIRYMPVNLEQIEIFFLEKVIVSKVDAMFADAWLAAAKKKVDHYLSLSEEDQIKYSEDEDNNKPMSLDLFDKELEEIRPQDIELFTFADINLQDIAQSARKMLAELWGISDAFCKISKN